MMERKYDKLPDIVETAAKYTVDSAYTIHKRLGVGLPEKTYERFMVKELRSRGFNVKTQIKIPIV
ncbi:GxxExxY protein [Methanooceanicella nereidis]|uniref:GxxExxY protein n=1 Tax=Methanooceanicella nereidis TaxID=2052831 RepID=UPI002103EBEE|nr:GxxExxY protein [Methanocella sp. CWC-04]